MINLTMYTLETIKTAIDKNPDYLEFEYKIFVYYFNIWPNRLIKSLYHNTSFYENNSMFKAIQLTNELPEELKYEITWKIQ